MKNSTLSECFLPYAMSRVISSLNFIITYLLAGKDLDV